MIYRNIVLFFLGLLFFTSCKKAPTFQSVEIQINDNWTFRQAGKGEWLPAKVPGDVFTDLFENHIIEDPFYDENEDGLKWIGESDWEYRTNFDVPLDVLKNDRVYLQFSGLDTYADIYLNGRKISECSNMFRVWDVNCKESLMERNNELRIYFHSAIKKGLERINKNGYSLPSDLEQAPEKEQTSPFTRKAAFQYGWEGGPRFVGCGIWRPVSIRAWSNARIKDLYLNPLNVSTDTAEYRAELDLEVSKKGKYKLTCFVDDQPIGDPVEMDLEAGQYRKTVNFEIDHPDLWWCNGMGSQYLYTFRVQLSLKNNIFTEKIRKFGVRKLELIQDSDASGHSFYFLLNGVPVFAKGAAYVPPDVFYSGVTGETYEKITGDAVNANMNMLRIWGGGVYENDTLYDLCDSKGLLVWQEFMFASSMQPGDSSYLNNIREEALENVKRLRNHPCLALWCGNSNGLVSWKKNGWKSRYPRNIADSIWSAYQKIFYSILPGVVKEISPHTPYKASTPSSFNNQLPGKKSGDWHDWNVFYGVAPFSSYYEKPARFVSEYGMQSFPGMNTLSLFAKEEEFDVDSSVMNFHQRSGITDPPMTGNQVIASYIQMYYNNPADFESFVYLSQIAQADALKTAIEAHRLNKPETMGSVFWHFNDCWPGITWSVIDYYGNYKPAFYTVKRSFSNVLAVSRLIAGTIKTFVVSDSIREPEVRLRIRMMDFDGHKIGGMSRNIKLRRDSVQYLWSARLEEVCPGELINKAYLQVQVIDKNKLLSENILYFNDPKYLDLPEPEISYRIEGSLNKFDLFIVSPKLAKNVVLDTYEKSAVFSDNNFDLLPGREIHLSIHYQGNREELSNDLKVSSLADTY